jgi:DNA-binding XRE family transcriptional regulator
MMTRDNGDGTEVVPGMAEAIEARRVEMKIGKGELAKAAGVTAQGIAPLRKGYRRRYQERLTRPFCEALGWTPDSIERLMSGLDPIVTREPPARRDQDIQHIDYRALLDALDRSNHRLDDHFDEVRRELQELRRQLDDLDRRENNSHQ